MNQELIEHTIKNSLAKLSLLKNHLSNKQYQNLESKIAKHKLELEAILGIEKIKEDQLAEFSYVLDQAYFKQIRLQ